MKDLKKSNGLYRQVRKEESANCYQNNFYGFRAKSREVWKGDGIQELSKPFSG